MAEQGLGQWEKMLHVYATSSLIGWGFAQTQTENRSRWKAWQFIPMVEQCFSQWETAVHVYVESSLIGWDLGHQKADNPEANIGLMANHKPPSNPRQEHICMHDGFTHWGLGKMAATLDMTFRVYFHEWKHYISNEILLKYASYGLADNKDHLFRFTLGRWQVIICTNDDIFY